MTRAQRTARAVKPQCPADLARMIKQADGVMATERQCPAIAVRFCSGETSEDDCMECMEFVNTCDECFSPGSNGSDGWCEGPDFKTLCQSCFDKYEAKPND